VIVATPDHWHARIATDAMRAKKAVYLEKPMIHHLEEGPGLIEVEKETGQVLVVGSQRVSSAVYEKAGPSSAPAPSALSTWSKRATTEFRDRRLAVLDPDRRLAADHRLGAVPRARPGAAPSTRCASSAGRNYWDYGTGVPGDLFVHLFSGIHFALGSNGPRRVAAMGGLRHWKDGRDAPDVMVGLFDYPATPSHPPFTMSLQVNFADGSGGSQEFRFVGTRAS